MRYSTGNPVGADGSSSPFDLYDNAGVIDQFATDKTKTSCPDRLGVQRKTIHGMEQDFYNFLVRSGYELPALEYVDGSPLVVDRPTQLVSRTGQLYSVKVTADFPVTLTGAWADDEPNLVERSDSSILQQLSGPGGSALVGRGVETVDVALDRIGEASQLASGGVVENVRDYALDGTNMLPALAGFTKVGFDALGNHAAGTVGTMTAETLSPATDFTHYKVVVELQTTAPGRVNIKFGSALIFSDQPNGYYLSTAPIKAVGSENNRDINGNTYTFPYFTSGSTFTSVSIETDTFWAGQIFSVSLIPQNLTMFAQAGCGQDGQMGPVGFKVGAYGRNDIAFGDPGTLGFFKYDGLPKTPGHNAAAGAKALNALEHGDENTAFGTYALQCHETSNSTAFGYSAAKMNTKGRELTAIGYKALTNNTTGSAGTAVGFWALGQNTVGTDNTAIGWYALRNLLLGSLNFAAGSNAGMMASGGSGNIFVGAYAGYGSGTGFASYSNTTVVGREAWAAGDNGVAIGIQARTGTLSVASAGSVAVGASSSATGSSPSVAVGSSSSASGASAVAVGPSSTAAGAFSLAVGGSASAAAQFVTAIGAQAGAGSTGINNTFLGALAGSAANSFTGCTYVGLGTTVTGNDQNQIGGTGTTTYVYGTVQNRSDERDKADVRESSLGLDFLMGLEAVEGKWDLRDDYVEMIDEEYEAEEAYASTLIGADGQPLTGTRTVTLKRKVMRKLPQDGSKKRKRYHQWFIAQKVKALCDQMGVEFGGLQHHAVTGGDDVWSLGYDEFIPVIVNSLQQAVHIVRNQEARLAKLEKIQLQLSSEQ